MSNIEASLLSSKLTIEGGRVKLSFQVYKINKRYFSFELAILKGGSRE